MEIAEIREGLSYDDIVLLPNFTDISSRKEIDLSTNLSKNNVIKYPVITSPMDTISDVETCVAMNSIGAAGILHRFMSIDEQCEKAKEIKFKSNKCYVAIGLKDYEERIRALHDCTAIDLFVLDCANGLMNKVYEFALWYKKNYQYIDLCIGNTLTKESVYRYANIGIDAIRHNIGPGSQCITTKMTGIGCPAITANYYAWKATRNYELSQFDHFKQKKIQPPSILVDGGIRIPADLVKAIVSGADAVICGSIFAGCKETPGEILYESDVAGKLINEKLKIQEIKDIDFERLGHWLDVDEKRLSDCKKFKKFRGMASKEVVEDYELWDGNKENLFVEGKESIVPYTDKSVTDTVYEFVNGLKSSLSYLGFSSLKQAKGTLWTGETIALRVTQNFNKF